MSKPTNDAAVTAIGVTGTGATSTSNPNATNSPAMAALQKVQASYSVALRPAAPVIDNAGGTHTDSDRTLVSSQSPPETLVVQKQRVDGPPASARPPTRGQPSVAQGPGVLRRMSTAVAKTVQSVIGPVNPVTGPTPSSVIRKANIGFEKNYFKHHTFRDENKIEGTEGEIYVVRNLNKPEMFVVKHTRAMPWSTERDLPCEAAILLEHLHAHPRIIAIFDSLPDLRAPGRHRIFMEYCSAGSLAEQYTHWGSALKKPMPEIFLLHVLVQGCEALAFIHRGLRYAGRGQYTQDLHYQPIIHGDVKEDNFLLHWDYFPLPEIKLADFGNAKLAHAKDSRIQPGTLCFHAPEDVAIYGDLQPIPENARAFDEMIDRRTIASDMYAFGLMMYMFATCDRYPVKIGTDPSTMRISREYRTPGLLELIKKMLGIDPAERAEASFVPPNGVLAQVHEMWTARDMLLGARENPKGEEWFVLAPKGHHAG